MENNNKLASFTIMETIIGMVILAIIISLVFYIFQSLTQTFEYYTKTRLKNNEYLMANNVLNTDFFNSIEVEKTADNSFVLISNHNDTIYYSFDNNKLYREKANVVEKFDVLINSYEINGINNDISKLEIDYYIFGEPIRAIYYKNYGCSKSVRNFVEENVNK